MIVNCRSRVEKEAARGTALIKVLAFLRSKLHIQFRMFFRRMSGQSSQRCDIDAVFIRTVSFYIRDGVVSLKLILLGAQISHILNFIDYQLFNNKEQLFFDRIK